jgi:hypothetical protein
MNRTVAFQIKCRHAPVWTKISISIAPKCDAEAHAKLLCCLLSADFVCCCLVGEVKEKANVDIGLGGPIVFVALKVIG